MSPLMSTAILITLVTCAFALKCYSGTASGNDKPSNQLDCPPTAKYCMAATVAGNQDAHTHGCETGLLCKKDGCETANLITTCCCTTDLCNEGVNSGSKPIPAVFFLLSIIIAKLIVY
ncbi:unnamed protein product [Cylicocyclus nassatus]|uniref:Snake toxin/toxin-like domain-containing protein n=1 Tax=Cylicocyclus nassatus TaxID=53992 RepID=A0AA36GU16_CYLNA|nr:unnamed protein product [Cylicocyclus nassatus]